VQIHFQGNGAVDISQLDFADSFSYEARLSLSPDDEHYGLWIREGDIEHCVNIRKRLPNLVFIGENQEGESLVWSLPAKCTKEWDRFARAFLSDHY
jgi:hypothetical protein